MNIDETREHNHRLMRLQAFWGGAANGAWVIFAIPFLIRLEASILLISIYVALTSLGPLLMGPIAVANLRSIVQQRRWMIICGVLSRIFFFMPAVALLFDNHRAEIAVVMFCLCALPTVVFGAFWAPTAGLVIEPEHQPQIVNSRTRIANIGGLSANGIIGLGMIVLPFPFNYVAVFFVSGALGLTEIYVISRIIYPDSPHTYLESFRANFAGKKIWAEKQFMYFLLGIILIVGASSVAAPLQSVYFIQERGVSDRWMGVWAMMLSAGAVIGTLIWRRLQTKTGSYAILAWTVPVSAVYFLLIVISPNIELILIATLFAGLLNAGTDVGIWLGLYRFGDEARRTMLINIYIGFALGIPFVAALFIPFFTNKFTLTEILIGSFVIRFIVGLYFKIPKVYDLLKDEVPGKSLEK
jgi:Na+/melibiose symporter-like transporter